MNIRSIYWQRLRRTFGYQRGGCQSERISKSMATHCQKTGCPAQTELPTRKGHTFWECPGGYLRHRRKPAF